MISSAAAQHVAQQFSRAAATYADHASVQQQSAEQLLTSTAWQGVLLDVGCGRGEMARRLAVQPAVEHVLALDLSAGMLAMAVDTPGEKLQAILANALALPLAAASVDGVLSNFAVHWCLSPAQVLAEMARVLRPQATLALAVPLAGSLSVLPGHQHPTLMTATDWLSALSPTQWQLKSCQQHHFVQYYPDARAWFAGLQAMGVNHLVGSRLRPSRYRQCVQALQAAAEPQGIPMAFTVLQVLATRQPAAR